MLAVIASLLLISLYIGFRFEWKFAVPVLIALAHDLLITAGVYALFEREVTTATVAALLTILGYSLYDTVIVFDRIRENVPRMPRATFSQIANRSMSEVLTRSLATSFVVLMPVGSLLLFGGETLKDFAFALLVGVISGAYSSIFIATPVLVEWKEREPTYMRRRRLMLQEYGGHVPAFATGTLGEPEVAAARRPRSRRAPRRRAAHGRRPPPARTPTVQRPPGAQPETRRRRRRQPLDDDRRGRPRHRRAPPPERAAEPAGRAGPPGGAPATATATGAGAEAEAQAKVEAPAEAQKAREALDMAMVVWVMMGIAVWHFTVFLPDRFWGGIVGAFARGVPVRGDLRILRERPAPSRARATPTSSQALIAIPGAMIGLALSYWYGARMDRETRHRPRPDESRRALAARSVRLASQYQWDAVQAVSLAERPL